MDRRGIAVFLLVTFGLAFAIEALILSMEWVTFRTRTEAGIPIFWGLFCIPALAALIASSLGTRELPPKSALWPIPWARILFAFVIVTLVLAATYAVEIATGVSRPDWTLSDFRELLPTAQELNLPSELPSAFLIALIVLINLVMAVIIYGPLCLISEFGWRGYLQPRLMVKGVLFTFLTIGILWGLWFAPIASSEPVGIHPWSTATRVAIMAIVFSLILGQLYRLSGSLWPGAVLCGTFVAHSVRFPEYLMSFIDSPWGGPVGIVSILIWSIVAVLFLVLTKGVSPAVETRNV